MIGRDFDLWVDVIKFVWLVHGVSGALDFVRGSGLHTWSRHSLAVRLRYVDDLVLLAQKKLRSTGTKFSEMAEFFADAETAKARSDLH
jgi:hypothetical protein